MASFAELQFAQRYPFSQTAKQIIRENDIPLDKMSEPVFERSKARVFSIMQRKAYKPKAESSQEILLNEILAFPLSKVMVSCMASPDICKRFSESTANGCFESLTAEKDATLNDLAIELGVKFSPSADGVYFAEISLFDFLAVNFAQEFMRLVNLKLEHGTVYLTKNEFCRYLSRFIFRNLNESLPLPIIDVPRKIKDFSKQLYSDFASEQKKAFPEMKLGNVRPELFPECMSSIYLELANNGNPNHIKRFDLACFLIEAGMEVEPIVELFKRAPNFNEKVTRYHLNNIKQHGYSPPSCAKLREHGITCANCTAKHPMQIYRKNLAAARKQQK